MNPLTTKEKQALAMATKIAVLLGIAALLFFTCPQQLPGQTTNVRQLGFNEPPPPPVTVNAAPSGPGGNRTYFYWVVANYFAGSSVPAGPAQVRAANPLTGSNGVSVSWSPAPDAISYDILRADTNASPLVGGTCANCAVATGVVVNFVADTGGALGPYTLGTLIPNGEALAAFTNTNAVPPRLNWTTNGPYTFRMDKNTWTVIGLGTQAQRPATCVGGHDVYVCKGTGCGLPPDELGIDYCIPDNNWVRIPAGSGGAGYDTIEDEGIALPQRTILNFTGGGVACADNAPDTDCVINGGNQFFTVVNEGPVINLPATCVEGDVYICNGAGCRGRVQLEIYYCTAVNTWETTATSQWQVGTFANLPGCVTNMSDTMYGFTDSYYEHAFCDGTNWSYYRDGLTMVPPATLTLTPINVAADTTIITTTGAAILRQTTRGAAGSNYAYYVEALPAAADYTVSIAASLNDSGQQNFNKPYGIVLRNSATGDAVVYSIFYNSGTSGTLWQYEILHCPTQPGVCANSFATPEQAIENRFYCLRVVETGGNYLFQASNTCGVNANEWETKFTEASGVFTTADQWGVAINAQTITFEARAVIYHMEATTP